MGAVPIQAEIEFSQPANQLAYSMCHNYFTDFSISEIILISTILQTYCLMYYYNLKMVQLVR